MPADTTADEEHHAFQREVRRIAHDTLAGDLADLFKRPLNIRSTPSARAHFLTVPVPADSVPHEVLSWTPDRGDVFVLNPNAAGIIHLGTDASYTLTSPNRFALSPGVGFVLASRVPLFAATGTAGLSLSLIVETWGDF